MTVGAGVVSTMDACHEADLMGDTIMNEYGARGIGEIGLTGCASALTSATYHATGVRVRELPIRIEKLLERA